MHARNGDLGLDVQMLQSELEAVKSDRPEVQESVPQIFLNQAAYSTS
ncbi:MAG: hypothetical protein U7126_28605 [Microcoleus sp.]